MLNFTPSIKLCPPAKIILSPFSKIPLAFNFSIPAFTVSSVFAFANAFEYVDKHKQERLRTTAEIYLSQNETDLQPRFDVVEIYAPEGTLTQQPKIHHMEDAFQ